LVFASFLPYRVSADVNDFSFSSFDADYYLSTDSEGRSMLKVVETLTAEFINKDQNRGIERAVPITYDNHSLLFEFKSMTRNGNPEPLYEQRKEPNFIILSTRRNDPVNGTQKYTFTYTFRDVTKSFGDHQELYWDTNGTGWRQQFGDLNVRVHLDDSIKKDFTGAVSCYIGQEGSTRQCVGKTNDNVISFGSNGPLAAGENLTYDLSFNNDTFVGYQPTLNEMMPYILSTIAGLLFLAMIFIKLYYGRNSPGMGTIIAEYLPPPSMNVSLAADISDKTLTSSTAQILDFAVRHKIRVIETKGKFLFMDSTTYILELLNIDDLDQNELEFIDILFGNRQLGSQYTFNKTDTKRARLMMKLGKVIKKESENQGYRQKKTPQIVLQNILVVLITALIVAEFVLSISNSNNFSGYIVIWALYFFLMSVNWLKLLSIRPLTQKGREVHDYLKGLKMYIKLAEADRLRVLQSPEGADKLPIDTSDNAKMIVLYERVLPYAVLFGAEKEWLKQLGNYYETNQTSPAWYSGVGGFNASTFASSIGSFSSYSNSSSFSSSSGASGGGSSGGGGGGGGGGGV